MLYYGHFNKAWVMLCCRKKAIKLNTVWKYLHSYLEDNWTHSLWTDIRDLFVLNRRKIWYNFLLMFPKASVTLSQIFWDSLESVYIICRSQVKVPWCDAARWWDRATTWDELNPDGENRSEYSCVFSAISPNSDALQIETNSTVAEFEMKAVC